MFALGVPGVYDVCMKQNTNPETFPIAEAATYCGYPTVWLATEVTTIDRHGNQVVIDEFWVNGGVVRASGWKFRKNGERATRKMQSLEVTPTQNIVDALAALEMK